MRKLQQCLRLKHKIDEITDEIYELRAKVTSPKNQIITGMPRGGGSNENLNERYLIRLEYLTEKRHKLRKHQSKEWKQAKKELVQLNIFDNSEKDEIISLFFWRFVKGLSWKKCVSEMDSKYGNWNINKAFRVHNKVKQYYHN